MFLTPLFRPEGAALAGRWVDAGDLQVGDEVWVKEGQAATIEHVRIMPFAGTVYNIEVDDLHCYAIGGAKILVHNDNGLETLASGQSKRIGADDLGLPEGSSLSGSVARRGDEIIVRIEAVTVPAAARGQKSMSSVVSGIRNAAASAGAKKLTIEGVSVVNAQLARVLVQRYGAKYTPQKTLLIQILLNQ